MRWETSTILTPWAVLVKMEETKAASVLKSLVESHMDDQGSDYAQKNCIR